MIIEASRQEVRERPPEHTEAEPLAILRSADAWMMDYDVPFIFEACRLDAEQTCYWLLNRWWERRQEKDKSK